MGSTPLWVTMTVGVLGPLATILAVALANRSAARRAAQQEANESARLRTEYELTCLIDVEDCSFAVQRAALVAATLDASDAKSIKQTRDELRILQMKLRRAATRLQDVAMWRRADQAIGRISYALGLNDSEEFLGFLPEVATFAGNILEAATRRTASLKIEEKTKAYAGRSRPGKTYWLSRVLRR